MDVKKILEIKLTSLEFTLQEFLTETEGLSLDTIIRVVDESYDPRCEICQRNEAYRKFKKSYEDRDEPIPEFWGYSMGSNKNTYICKTHA